MARANRFPWEFEGETVVVETPEQTRLEFRIAPWGARFAAALIDRLIIAGAFLVLGFVFLMLLTVTDVRTRDTGAWFVAAIIVTWFLVSTLYFVVAEIRGEGLTPGKRRLHLRTVMGTGHGLTAGASIVRNLARLVDEIPLFWLVPALTTGNRRIGDMLAGTFVVMESREPAKARRKPWIEAIGASWREVQDRRFAFTAAHAQNLHPDDLNLIEYLDQRLGRMPAKARRKALGEIAARYVERLGMHDQREAVAGDAERFLQELGLFLRARYEDAPV